MKEQKPLEKTKDQLELNPIEIPKEKKFTKIDCPSCGSEVAAENLHLPNNIAKCGNCNAVFSFQESITSLEHSNKHNEEILRPAGIDLYYFRDEMELIVKQPWTAIEIIAIMLFPFFAALMTLVYFKKGGVPDWALISLWFGAIFSIVNAFLRSKHKVYMTIDSQYLTRQWRPKKLIKDKQFRVGEIDQLYVKLVDGVSYGVMMILNKPEGQKHVSLITGFSSITKAHFIEQEIEKHLGIEDRRVADEHVGHAPHISNAKRHLS